MDNNKTDVTAIVDRMKIAVGVARDKELAEYLGSSKSGPAVWKSRGSIPISECIKIAQDKSCSLDWLILGRGGDATALISSAITDRTGSNQVEIALFDMATYLIKDAAAHAFVTVPRAVLDELGLLAAETMIVRAAGDAMAGTIADGQYVIIDRRPRSTDGVYLVRFGEVLRLARLQRLVRGATRVSYENPSYAVDVIPPEPDESIEVIGFCYSLLSRVI